MTLRTINMGSMAGFHVYDDSDFSEGINISNGTVQAGTLTATNVIGDVLVVTGAQRIVFATLAQITANTNDWDIHSNFTDFQSNLRVSSDAARNVTGILAIGGAGIGDGFYATFVNIGSFNITFKNQDANSSANNRLINISGGDSILTPNDSVTYIYDNTTSRWRELVSGSSATGLGVALSDIAANSSTGAQNTYQLPASVDLTIDDSGGNPILVIDEANARVGIGTASPQAKLHIASPGDVLIENRPILRYMLLMGS